MPLPFLGAINLYWCDRCNLPIVELPKCSCGQKLRKVEIAPPGDYRPAFNPSLEGFRKRLDELYGVGAGSILLPQNKLILLNRTSFVDRMDEVVVDGYVLGKLFYDLSIMQWGFKLTLEGGRRLHLADLGYRVVVDKGAVEPLSRGANVLAAGVDWADQRINPGDEVIVETPEKWIVSVGTARMTGKNMIKASKGLAVKPRQYGKKLTSHINQNVGQEWSDAVKANSEVIQRYETQAIEFIHNTRAQFQKPCTLAFSGGKDSLVTLLLTMKALDEPFNIIFADTGIELPETLDYIKEIGKKYKLQERLIIHTANDRFWEDLEVFGPPARDYRWCCKTCKLAIIGDIIVETYPEGCLTFVGQRRYESTWRAAEGKISQNPWVAGQTRATPIKNWNAFLIWLYVFREDAPINPLYKIGYERIGCWLCPANRMADFENLKKNHPKLFRKWQDYLEQFQEKQQLPEIWKTLGLWRWKNLPKTMMAFLQKHGIEYTHKGSKALVNVDNAQYRIAEGVTPCVGGGVSVQAKFNMGLPIEPVANLCTILGDVRFSEDLGAIYLKLGDNITANIFSDGSYTVRGAQTSRKARSIAHKLGGVITRAIKCTGCGICQQHCTSKAISIRNKHVKVEPSKCNQCGECHVHCPILI